MENIEIENMTYESVCKKMEIFMKENPTSAGEVLLWINEFGEFNFEYCKEILKCLYTCDDPQNGDYYPAEEEKIRNYAGRIYNRGGLDALQSNFYIMSNFMFFGDIDKYQIHKYHTYNLKFILDGVGGWRA